MTAVVDKLLMMHQVASGQPVLSGEGGGECGESDK